MLRNMVIQEHHKTVTKKLSEIGRSDRTIHTSKRIGNTGFK